MSHAKKIIFSFKYAFQGVKEAIKTERNLNLQILVGLLGIFCAIFFRISVIEWLFCIIVWTLDFSLELTNTAIEEIVNNFTIETHPGAKRAKDIAAAAVMVAFLAEGVTGLIIFVPHIITLFI